MIDFIGCLAACLLGLFLSDYVTEKQAKILTILGSFIVLYAAKEGYRND